MALKEKLIDKAQKLIQKGSLDKAIIEYRAAADADPKDISIRLRIGDLYVKIGKKTEAVKEYTEAARANAQRGFYLKAIAVYKQILKLDDTIDTRNKLADLYIKQRLIADAIGEYSHMVSWFEQRGKSGEVLELLKKMVDIDPENVGVRLKLAELYQKLSFKEDALNEYSAIFEKLLAAGKLDTAEKIYLSLYSSNPADVRVLSGLSELYRLKGEDGERLKFLKGLLNHYSNASMDEDARRAALDIVKISPGDPHASKFLKKAEKAEPVVQPSAESGPEPFSVASSIVTEAAAVAEAATDALPEEEIEINIEGFDEGDSEEAVLAGEPVEAAAVVEAKASESTAAVSGSMDSDGAPQHIHIETLTPVPGSEDEVEIDIEEFLSAVAPQVETAESQPGVAETAVETHAPQVPEQAAAAVETVVEPVSAEPSADAGMEEAISIISTVESGEGEPTPQEEAALASYAVEVVEESHAVTTPEPEPIAVTGNEPFSEIAHEPVEAAAVVEEVSAIEIIDIKPEVLAEEPEPVAPAPEQAAVAVEPSIPVETAYVAEESPVTSAHAEAVIAEPAHEPVEVPVETPEPVEAVNEEPVPVEPAPEEEEVREEDLSSAIQELMDKMEPAGAEAQEAPQIAETREPVEEYVDLSAELGMEEALKDLAEPWGGKESVETFDEFKDGIGKQLNKEDSETHYNLGIAYMEMELFGEASKEFKIALKDARLELDCYTRLGLCAMAENNPEEAAFYYSKGLKAAVRSDEEKKGLMYELALAYEASGRDEDAYVLFQEIFEMDPDFREAALKVSTFVSMRPCVPLNDGFIEVEFL